MNLSLLKSKIKSGEIDTVLLVIPDVFGRLVGKRFTASYFLSDVLGHGTHVCNYLLAVNIEMDPLDGFQLANWDKGFGDFVVQADLATVRLLPWQPGAVMILGDLFHSDGSEVAEAPRTVLRNQVKALEKRGLHCCIASELEFYLFNQTYHEAHLAGHQNLQPASDYRIDYHTMQPSRDEALMRTIRQGMIAARVPVECSKGEWGKGQHEINFTYDAPLPMADMHVVFKQGIKEIAEQNGKAITFMAKYLATEAGSSCHIHISIWKNKSNLFWDSQNKTASRYFRQFLGGLMKYTPDISCWLAPNINSYKRYQAASWAPTKMAWSTDNRTVGFRVVGHGNSLRIENRMPGADANPYLAFAGMLAAGMAGVDEDLDCGDAYVGNAYTDSKLPALPGNLQKAADMLSKSQLFRKVFGNEVVDFYSHTAFMEVQAFNASVTDWERTRYFERI